MSTNMKGQKPAPAEIEFKGMRFLITDRPNDLTVERYVKEIKRYNVKDVVRVCSATYRTEMLSEQGIRVLDCPFDDGCAPPSEVVDQWFSLLRDRFSEEPGCCVAVHCVAGLGRAPVLVAIALIELGMKYEDAVELIRQKRRGAINSKQLAYLDHYRPKSRLKVHKNGQKGCVVM